MNQETISAVKDFVARKDVLSEGTYLLNDIKVVVVSDAYIEDEFWSYSKARVHTTSGEIQIRRCVLEYSDYLTFFWILWCIYRGGELDSSDLDADALALKATISEYPSFSRKEFGLSFLTFFEKVPPSDNRAERIKLMVERLKEKQRVKEIFAEASLHLLASILFIGGWVISVLIVGWITTPLLAYFPNYQSQVIISMIIVWGFLFVELLVQVYRIEKSWNLFLNTKEKENG